MTIKEEYIKKKKTQKGQFLLKVGIPYLLISLFIFIFGYDTSMFEKNKLLEFLPPFIFLFLLIIIIANLKYKIKDICPKCGVEIKNLKKDCIIGQIDFLGTKDKIEYKNVTTTIKGKTVYPRGGYSMRNSVMEHTSESAYEVNQKIPVTKKIYVYSIEYKCKKCNEVFCKSREEFLEPLNLNKKI